MGASQRRKWDEKSGLHVIEVAKELELGLFCQSPVRTWALWGKTLWDQPAHPDSSRGLSCQSPASFSTGVCSADAITEGALSLSPQALASKEGHKLEQGTERRF